MKGKFYQQCQCSRRTVLKAGAAAAAFALTGNLAACGQMEPLETDLVIDLEDYPALQSVGGVAALSTQETGYDFVIFVVRQSEERFLALSGECTHHSCEVRDEGTEFLCPCHASRFAHDGTLLQGPARTDLHRFETRFDGERIEILATL